MQGEDIILARIQTTREIALQIITESHFHLSPRQDAEEINELTLELVSRIYKEVWHTVMYPDAPVNHGTEPSEE